MRVPGYVGRTEFKEYSKRVEEEQTRQNHRLKGLESGLKQITDLTISVNKIATTMESMLKEQQAQGKRLANLEATPGKNWNTLTKGILGAIAAAIGGGVVALIINFIH